MITDRKSIFVLYSLTDKFLTFSVKFVKSKKGRRALLLNSYIYRPIPSRSEITRWRCSTNSNYNCRAHVITENNEFVRAYEQHSHEPPKMWSYTRWEHD
ncbi:hypothetical protein RR46_00741 [Papilio xuthus]|uniref:FLYWCH-type domain-containing protein n=1 Tax=Papilio xuthus TaxID=66420 RepID=A0A0N1I5P0_PAPXU|nr:hypothetical protein RR46_00741 [Papilio xuthus]